MANVPHDSHTLSPTRKSVDYYFGLRLNLSRVGNGDNFCCEGVMQSWEGGFDFLRDGGRRVPIDLVSTDAPA